MNVIFSDILEACANWFLYIFIEENAPLNNSIMRKRANQIAWLKRLDAINPTYNYNQLVNIVHKGIVKKYGQTPAQVLTVLYTTGINGIGSTQSVDNLTVEATDENGVKKKSNFWTTIDKVLEYIKKILEMLGIGKTADIQPVPSDWYKPTKSGFVSNAGSFLPWIAAAGIIFYASNANNANSNNKRKNKN